MNNEILICPVCKDTLMKTEKSYRCRKGHCFDIARQGYINLLPVQNKHSLLPGDTKAMLSARRTFLDKGYYFPLCCDIIDMLRKYCASDKPVIADIGCGEGYYTKQIKEQLSASCIGADISKEAAKMACSRDKDILWAVATASALPIKSSSTDAAVSVFALFMNDEYARILKSGGVFIEVTAGSLHLTELKHIIYDEVFEQHKKPAPFGEQFEMLEMLDRKFVIEPEGDDLKALLAMTPHIHRISREQSERLNSISKLSLTVNYIIRVLRKK